MHLLYLQQLLVLPGEGGNDRCWRFARQWTEAGHRVTFIASDAHLSQGHPWRPLPPVGEPVEQQGIEVYFVPVAYAHRMPFWRRAWAFAVFLQKAGRLGRRLGGFDAVLAYSAPLSVGELGRRLARHHGVPFFFEVADVWPDVPIGMGLLPAWGPGAWLQRRTHRMYAAARRIFPFSPGMATQIQAHGVPPAKLLTIPNGCDLAHIPYQPRRSSPTPPLTLLYTGTVGRANDLGQLMQALALIEGWGRDDLRTRIVGQGNDLARVQALAQELKLRHVSFEPPVSREQATQLLAQGDIGVVCFAAHPVLEANAATKFFDYLAAGLPLVINYQGWQADYLARYDCGLSSPQGDVAALARNLLRLADDPALRARFSRQGRQLAVREFDRERLAEQMLEAMVRGQ